MNAKVNVIAKTFKKSLLESSWIFTQIIGDSASLAIQSKPNIIRKTYTEKLRLFTSSTVEYPTISSKILHNPIQNASDNQSFASSEEHNKKPEQQRWNEQISLGPPYRNVINQITGSYQCFRVDRMGMTIDWFALHFVRRFIFYVLFQLASQQK